MGSFFKQLIASILGTFIALGLMGGVSIGAIALLAISLAANSKEDTKPSVANGSLIEFDLATTVEAEPKGFKGSDALNEILGAEVVPQLSLRSLVDTLEAAARDDRITGLYLYSSDGSFGISGYATLKEVRRALDRFRSAGKTIVAYGVAWDEASYYLTSAADEVWLNPFGVIEFNGLASSEMFLTGAFEKYGIGVQVVRTGKYKAAVEPFTLKQRSPESRQQLQGLLGDLWQDVVATAATERKVTPQQLGAIAGQRGQLRADRAEVVGAIDGVAYQDEMLTKLGKLAPTDDEDRAFAGLSFTEYAKAAGSTGPAASRLGRAAAPQNAQPAADDAVPQVSPQASDEPGEAEERTVALLYANGAIVSDGSGTDNIDGDRLAADLRKLRENDDIAAIVLRIDSPGGSATASEIVQREVKLIRDRKPIVVSMGNYAASGGYWIATYGSHIVAEPTTITGSIGVFGLLPNVQTLGANNGITWDVVKTSPLADLGTVTRPKTPAELAIFQESVNWVYDSFLNKVAQSRQLPRERVAQLAQGRVWSGTDARQLGLVDELGGLETAIAAAVRLAKLETGSWQLDEYPQSEGFDWEPLLAISARSRAGSAIAPLLNAVGVVPRSRGPLASWAAGLQSELSWLDSLDDPQGVYARMPYRLEIR